MRAKIESSESRIESKVTCFEGFEAKKRKRRRARVRAARVAESKNLESMRAALESTEGKSESRVIGYE